ncbi:hypothetical protein [Marivita lacus]|uniref:hypothetical protein n=1 Tax=Marivita lacus TaxID=1323742 RepID=UPI00166D253E|nr:hypothetical protein [Marivita lacus]
MSKPTEYLMPEKLVALVEQAKPSLGLLRLFHACYAYVDRNPLLAINLVALTGKPACRARCSDLSAITGSPGAKSSTWVTEVVEDDGWKALFSRLEIDPSGMELSFKFTPNVGQAAHRGSDKIIFAMVDGEEIRKISSANEALFYIRAVMVNQADWPAFDIPGICPDSAPWTDNRKKAWLRIAARVSERTGQHYVIIPLRHPLTRKIVRVRVKAVTGWSRWSPGYLFPRLPCPPVAIVKDGSYVSLKNGELREMVKWTRVEGP